jgi:hypothetical protein
MRKKGGKGEGEKGRENNEELRMAGLLHSDDLHFNSLFPIPRSQFLILPFRLSPLLPYSISRLDLFPCFPE